MTAPRPGAAAMMTEVCKARFEGFQDGSHAERIRSLPLEAMAKRY